MRFIFIYFMIFLISLNQLFNTDTLVMKGRLNHWHEAAVQLSLLKPNESQLSPVRSEAERSEVVTVSVDVGIKGWITSPVLRNLSDWPGQHLLSW